MRSLIESLSVITFRVMLEQVISVFGIEPFYKTVLVQIIKTYRNNSSSSINIVATKFNKFLFKINFFDSHECWPRNDNQPAIAIK